MSTRFPKYRLLPARVRMGEIAAICFCNADMDDKELTFRIELSPLPHVDQRYARRSLEVRLVRLVNKAHDGHVYDNYNDDMQIIATDHSVLHGMDLITSQGLIALIDSKAWRQLMIEHSLLVQCSCNLAFGWAKFYIEAVPNVMELQLMLFRRFTQLNDLLGQPGALDDREALAHEMTELCESLGIPR